MALRRRRRDGYGCRVGAEEEKVPHLGVASRASSHDDVQRGVKPIPVLVVFETPRRPEQGATKPGTKLPVVEGDLVLVSIGAEPVKFLVHALLY